MYKRQILDLARGIGDLDDTFTPDWLPDVGIANCVEMSEHRTNNYTVLAPKDTIRSQFGGLGHPLIGEAEETWVQAIRGELTEEDGVKLGCSQAELCVSSEDFFVVHEFGCAKKATYVTPVLVKKY